MAGGRMDERRANVSFSPLPSLNRWFSLPPHDFGSGSVGRSASPLCSASRSVCGALEASAHNVVIKLPRDHFDLRLNKGGSGSSHREGGREKRSQFVPPFFPPFPSLSLPFLFCIAPLSIENVQSDTHSNVGCRRRQSTAAEGTLCILPLAT